MRRLVGALALLLGCAHAPAIKDVSSCDQVQGEQRVECGACLAANEAEGWLGTFEYRPKENAGKRCVRVK